jgi:hypothetical protein
MSPMRRCQLAASRKGCSGVETHLLIGVPRQFRIEVIPTYEVDRSVECMAGRGQMEHILDGTSHKLHKILTERKRRTPPTVSRRQFFFFYSVIGNS